MQPFTFGGKSLSTTVLDDGDLLIEGMCVVFAGLDRQGENFAPGSFRRGIKAFLAGPASLCYHHKIESLIGHVIELEEIPNIGVRMRARVDGAIRKHPTLATVYAQIANGSLSGLSVAGFFQRAMTPAGERITDLDIVEISATPAGVHPGTSFAVIDGKALQYAIVKNELANLAWLRDRLEARELRRRRDLDAVRVACGRVSLGIRS